MAEARPARLFASWALTLLAAVSAAQAAEHPVVALPNGYYVERDRSAQFRIVKGHDRAVVGPIAGYAVYGVVVTGLVGNEKPPAGAYPNESPLPESSQSDYFVLDTTSGRIETGLSASALKARLAAAGVSAAPSIRAPIL